MDKILRLLNELNAAIVEANARIQVSKAHVLIDGVIREQIKLEVSGVTLSGDAGTVED